MTGCPPIDRRRFLALAGGVTASAAFPALARAENPSGEPLHGLSAFGDLKYPRGFTQFGYASPDAPAGGTFRFQPSTWISNQNPNTFNTLNSFVLAGDAPPRMELCFDSLMVDGLDEPDAAYCHLAESVVVSEDRNRFTFALRPTARWHDGTPVTAADVAFSMLTLKEKGNPKLAVNLTVLADAIVEDELTVTLVFDGTQSAQAILAAATLPVLSKVWHEVHDFEETTMEPPLGSGPYRLGAFDPGLYVEYERVDDYWGKDLATARGLDHFQTIRIDFFAERQAAFEALKKGLIDWREESVSLFWATQYDFPAITEGKVAKALFDNELRPRMQAMALNQRRERFRDRRVRDAIALCFDFEWTNERLFHGLYDKSHSTFSGSPFEATGLPGEDELALMDALSAQFDLPDGVEGEAWRETPSSGSGRDSQRRRSAIRLLAEAGWRGDDKSGRMVNAAGEQLALEFLFDSKAFERIFGPWVETLNGIGIDATMRFVDSSQYELRVKTFDFDATMAGILWSPTPQASGLRDVFGSQAAETDGSTNLPGVADPLVDAIIARISAATTRQEHKTAMRVLDRVLRLRRDWIPNWTSANHRVAYWEKFGFKEPKPDYDWPVERLWWFDRAKAEALGKA